MCQWIVWWCKSWRFSIFGISVLDSLVQLLILARESQGQLCQSSLQCKSLLSGPVLTTLHQPYLTLLPQKQNSWKWNCTPATAIFGHPKELKSIPDTSKEIALKLQWLYCKILMNILFKQPLLLLAWAEFCLLELRLVLLKEISISLIFLILSH